VLVGLGHEAQDVDDVCRAGGARVLEDALVPPPFADDAQP